MALNNGPRFQARDVSATSRVDRAIVVDNLASNLGICACADIETAKVIALALNRHFTLENAGAT